jgi:hypothetical protein
LALLAWMKALLTEVVEVLAVPPIPVEATG